MKKSFVMPIVALIALGGCGSSSNLSYSLSLNGCETGKHSFNSLEELCDGLKDDALNNGCALGLRAEMFEARECPGTFDD